VAEASSADLSVHLDHITDPALVREGVAVGASSVIVDASALPYARNVAATPELAAWCHQPGGLGAEL
jgi:fructose-bisphosphate aldolase class II